MKASIKTLPLLLLAVACQQKVDNEKSLHNFSIEMTASTQEIILDESKADQVALTIEWTEAADYGDDYITTYEYIVDHATSQASAIKEYEDEGNFIRSYTHKELQDMLVNRFGQKTSTRGILRFTISANFSGPALIIPDQASVEVRVKTYGAKQFAADEVYMGGSAVGEPVKLTAGSNPDVFKWEGNLLAGQLNFPVKLDDESNLIVPAGESTITKDPMPATVVESTVGGGWNIVNADSYRVTLNFANQTVSIIPLADIFELDKLFLAGSAIGAEPVEIQPCLEREGLYAFRGELKAGALYMPIEFDGASTQAIVPSAAFADGVAGAFTQTTMSTAESKAWNIPSDGVYRIVVDTDAKTVAIYSAATDLKNVKVSYNNTADGINPYEQEVTALWMYGGFNGWLYGTADKMPELQQSLADPTVFVYFGETLKTDSNDLKIKDETGTIVTQKVKGYVSFFVYYKANNVWAYGSTADAVRNSYNGIVTCEMGQTYDSVGGQANNRYAYFIIPEGANCVIVKIDPTDNKKATVKFEQR